mgnify:CR=1 FL=1
MQAPSRMLGYFASSPLPPKPAKQAAVDVALGGGRAAGDPGGCGFVLVSCFGASEGANPVNCQMMASSERARKVRLTSVKHGLKGRLARRPARRIATLNHSHLSALSGGLALLCGGDW